MAASGVPALAQGQALRPASRALPRPSTQHPAPSTQHRAPSTETACSLSLLFIRGRKWERYVPNELR